ncbi:hypothetical protein RHS03_08698, partial [Rhizoctonia solani]
MNPHPQLTPVCRRGAGSAILGADVWQNLDVVRIFRTFGVHRESARKPRRSCLVVVGEARGYAPDRVYHMTRAQQEAARRAEDRPRIDIDEVSDTEYSSPEEEESCRPLDDDTRRRIRSQRAPSPNSSPFSTINLSDIETSRPPSRERSDSEATAVPPPPSTSLWQSQNGRAPATNHRPHPPASYPTPPNSQAPVLQLTGLAPPHHTSSAPHRPPTPPKMAEASDQNLHWARERLRDLDRFNGKEITAKQVESTWRKRFCKMVNAYKVSDNQRRALWLEHLKEPSLAAKWAEQMEDEGKIGTWDALVKELGVRWPAPDEAEKQKERTERWYQHAIEEKKLGTKVEGIGGALEPYYVVWAREHMALAAEMSAGKVGKEKFMVEWTWHWALPSTLKGLLPKEFGKYKTIAKLCKDVISIEYNQVLRIASLEIQAQAIKPPAGPSQAPAQPKAATEPKTATTQPSMQARLAKGRGRTFGRSQPGYELYCAAINSLPANWLLMQDYPLTPGTYSQAANTCTRCGKGNHAAKACYGKALPENKMEWRKRTKEELGQARPGPLRAKIFQVLVERYGKEVAEACMPSILPNNTHTPPTLLYQQWAYLATGEKQAVKSHGTIDAGSQANVLDAALWAANKSSLGPLKPSQTLLQVADSKASQCLGQWTGQVKLAGQAQWSSFEVFDSGSAFKVLLGKPWLTQAKATQSFINNMLHLPGLTPIPNAYPLVEGWTRKEPNKLKEEGTEAIEESGVAGAKPEELKPEREEKVQQPERKAETGDGCRRSRRLAARGSWYWVPD